ncbi:ribosomal protein L23/L15e core domain-containing protein [Xylariaceae sp. FL0255]|nr:ribosomal protein L23/L15e core domain-containing protein [Xylariaceae sp. FL0255]
MATVTFRTRNFKTNPLLHRKQMIVDILHPGRWGVTRSEIEQALATAYKAAIEETSVWGLRNARGGGKTTGFACIYDNVQARSTVDVRYRLRRSGMATLTGDRRSRQNRMFLPTSQLSLSLFLSPFSNKG